MLPMSTQSAQVERVLAPVVETRSSTPYTSCCDDPGDREHPMSVARGIANAVLISVPFWALLVFALYLLI
jgi:hypothetical protein